MNKFITTTAAAALVAASSMPAMADSFNRYNAEPAAMLYYSMPFDGNSRSQEIPSYGFRIDKVDAGPRTGISFNNYAEQKPMMDLRFNDEGLQAWEFNGVNTLVQTTVHNAASGEAETVTSIDVGLVAIGVIGLIALADGNEDGDNCGVGDRFTFSYSTNRNTDYSDMINRISKGCPV